MPTAAPITLSIAASPDQRAVLEAAAGLAGMDVAAYVRAAALKRVRLDQAIRSGGGPPRDLDRADGRGLDQPTETAQAAADEAGEHAMMSCRWTLAQQPQRVPAQARALVRAVLHGHGPDVQGDVCVLLISELVTNAVRHGGPGPVTLQLVLTESEVVCGVGDRSRKPPWRRRAGPDDEGGRGLALLASLSSRWDWYPTAVGKTVWFARSLNGARQTAATGPSAGGAAHPLLDSAFPAVG
ncbi:ATP-binding protein [Spirillospora sp. NPDC127200]